VLLYNHAGAEEMESGKRRKSVKILDIDSLELH
jgi:hypothetical protein